MVYKSTTQPLCRCCGKPIRKWTIITRFGPYAFSTSGSALKDLKPQSKEEAQRHINSKVVSVSWHKTRKSSDYMSLDYDVIVRDYIDTAYSWDGESYMDRYFCKGTCAETYAYVMASMEGVKHTLQTKDYRDALAKRAEKEKANV